MRSLVVKLSLAFLLVSLIGIALVALFAGRVSTNEFGKFFDAQEDSVLVQQLANFYEVNDGWQGLERVGIGRERRIEGQTRPFAVIDDQGQVVLDGLGHSLGSRAPRSWLNRGIPISLENGQAVGRLIFAEGIVRRLPPPRNGFENRVNRAIFLAAVGATAVSLILGVILARSLTRPIQELTQATQAVAQGDLSQQLPIRSEDELGKLAASFNQMSADLTKSRDLRRQMTADIAHDLRTPLSLILGHAEALSEGVLPPKPETFEVIHDEAQRLNRLVEDLRLLSLAEAGELSLTTQLVSPRSLLERAVAAHAPAAQQKQIELLLNISPNLPEILVDPDRMAQVLDNLLSNGLRYTPENGRIQLTARQTPTAILLTVQDSGPGLDKTELTHLFDRFYRADKSRQRHEGGSGLGLAIAKSIVENHNGRIWVESELGQGATFIIELPSSKANLPN
ncbi:Two-component system sensor histidine kinase [hydrothermal vent metagenome]|uniref:histidine kinase n=1 Tax=hydrothermal vent metagenome TaxID=652676 RepID=A0A3B0VF76_9ZZZZ